MIVTDQTLVEVNAILQDAARKIQAVCGNKLAENVATGDCAWLREIDGIEYIYMVYLGIDDYTLGFGIPQFPTEWDVL